MPTVGPSEDRKLNDELSWVLCNRCLKQMGNVRIFLLSCKCLFCRDCLPKMIKNKQCLSCKASQVSFKPIGKELSPAEMDLFRPLKDQRSLKMMVIKQKFKLSQVDKALKIHSKYKAYYDSLIQEKEAKVKAEELEVMDLERKLEEKTANLEAKIKQYQQLIDDDANEHNDNELNDNELNENELNDNELNDNEHNDNELDETETVVESKNDGSPFLSF